MSGHELLPALQLDESVARDPASTKQLLPLLESPLESEWETTDRVQRDYREPRIDRTERPITPRDQAKEQAKAPAGGGDRRDTVPPTDAHHGSRPLSPKRNSTPRCYC